MRNTIRLLVACTCLFALSFPAQAEKRVALVVGNSAYQNTYTLANPVNDAEDVAAVLTTVGFDVIIERNLTKRGMESVIARFARLAQDSDTALVFYAGHGMQHRGQNYLMPVDAKLEDEFSLSFELNKIDDLMVGLERARGVKILILDACRNNPLAERLSRAATTRDFSLNRGLAKIEPTRGMVIAYSTQPNQVALDGIGRNSPFARSLVKEIDEPGLEIGTMFRRVARTVNTETDGKQLPELSVSLIGDFYLNARETDLQAWAKIRASNSKSDFQNFVRLYPKSLLLPDARQQLASLDQTEKMSIEQAEREKSRRDAERVLAEKAQLEATVKAESERKRLANEKTASDKSDVGNSQTKIALIQPIDTPSPTQRLDESALIKKIKKELNRVGCYTGAIDDNWTTISTMASVMKFAKLANLTTTPDQPDLKFLDTIRGKSARVCPLECGVRETEKNGRCIVSRPPTNKLAPSQKPIAGALTNEPPSYSLHRGETHLVDDGTCPKGQIKQIVGNLPKRIRNCIPR